MRILNRVLLFGVAAAAANAQFGRGGGEWMTAGNDAQRSSWVRSDAKISLKNMSKPGFDFIWKVSVDPGVKQAFAPPVMLDRYIGYRGFRSLAFVGGTADQVVGIDTDLGRVEWRKELASTGGGGCGGAMAAVTRPTTTAFPAQQAGMGGFGPRGGPAHSAVGTAFEGAVTIQQASANAAGRGAPGGRGPGGRGAAGFRRMPSVLDVLTRDGMLHSVYVSNGEAWQPPVRFVPANATVEGLIVAEDVAYVAAGQGCSAAPNEIVALDLESKQVKSFRAQGGSIAGADGFALGPDGTLYVATTAGDLLALAPKTLELKSAYKAGQGFATSPVIFEHGEKTWIAAATKDGRIHVIDSAAMHSAVATSSPASAPVSSLASWQDASGTRWLVGPTSGAIVAWKVTDRDGKTAIEPGWTSSDVTAPLAPVIVDGVAFTASTGASPVLHAMDAATGRDLWNSGRKIPAPIRGGGLSVGNNQIYLGANDGTLYVFGFPIEH